MVLVDAGAEHLGYASDISRTWPVSGRFSDAHRELYEAVLRVQIACIALCRGDGDMSMIRLHQESQLLMMEELATLGVIKPNLVGTPDGCVVTASLLPLYVAPLPASPLHSLQCTCHPFPLTLLPPHFTLVTTSPPPPPPPPRPPARPPAGAPYTSCVSVGTRR
jgi:hypothetical protein